MKKLIINADDFGLSNSVNQAVIKGWESGILTSTSLMVEGSAFNEAVQIAKDNPNLQVGLHLTLLQGKGTAEHEGFPSLLDYQGNFPNDPIMAGMRMFFLRPLRKQIAKEIEAQIEKFLSTGLKLSHIDGHLNIHMHPTVFDILCKLMPKYDIKSFRLSRERLLTELSISKRRFLGKCVDAFIFGRLAKRCRSPLEILGINYADEVKGLLNSGSMTEDYIFKALDRLQEGVTEIYLHPGYLKDSETTKWMPDYQHENELAALLSPKIKEKITKNGIKLCNYNGEEKLLC
ncbi:MAG: hopanoid biosynthesis-associated protein HpnK [Desulfuromonadales bacterium]|nr:hopanoid biosynthesis-associated protein HpnK [Desulfuromonadales bacterium]